MRLVVIWIAVLVVSTMALECFARIILFNAPGFGADSAEYTPYIINLPKEVIHSGEERDMVRNPLLNKAERTVMSINLTGETLLGDLEPNIDILLVNNPDHPYRLVTNANGLRRKKAVTLPKPAGIFRVFALGDSFTFGPYLSNQETWPALLEQMTGAEILNGGEAGYHLHHQLELFRDRGHKSEPDLVILQVLDNDLPGYGEKHRIRPKFIHGVAVGLRGDIILFIRTWSEHVALLRLLRGIKLWLSGAKQQQATLLEERLPQKARSAGTIVAPEEQRTGKVNVWFDESRRKELASYIDRNNKDFKELVKLVRDMKTSLLVLNLPTGHTLSAHRAGHDPVGVYYHELTNRYGVDYLDFTSAFAARPDWRELYLWPWNGHLSFKGNRFVAELLAPLIKKYRATTVNRTP